MAALVGLGIAHVPHDRAALEGLGDEGAIDDRRRLGGNKRQAKDREQGEDGKAPNRRGTENATPIHCIPPWVRRFRAHAPVRTGTVNAARTGKKGMSSVMPADSIAAAATKTGLRHVPLAALK